MATAADHYSSDQPFYRRMAVVLAAIIVFGFGQFAARGFVNFTVVPWWVHVHAVVFVGWLVLFVTQNVLAERGSLALHRKLGWMGAVLVAAMVLVGCFTAYKAIEMHRQPPFFTPAFFLALTHVGMAAFGAVVAAAIALRRDTEWHRRLMLTATVMLLEPAFGRILPMPLIGGETGEWIVLVIQLFVLGIAMRNDVKVRGRVHPALIWGAGIIAALHVTIALLARAPFWQALAAGIAGA